MDEWALAISPYPLFARWDACLAPALIDVCLPNGFCAENVPVSGALHLPHDIYHTTRRTCDRAVPSWCVTGADAKSAKGRLRRLVAQVCSRPTLEDGIAPSSTTTCTVGVDSKLKSQNCVQTP